MLQVVTLQPSHRSVDVSEVTLSQCLMEEYTPASNNSPPSCLLQDTTTDLITRAARTTELSPCSARRGRILKRQSKFIFIYSLKDIIRFSFFKENVSI